MRSGLDLEIWTCKWAFPTSCGRVVLTFDQDGRLSVRYGNSCSLVGMQALRSSHGDGVISLKLRRGDDNSTRSTHGRWLFFNCGFPTGTTLLSLENPFTMPERFKEPRKHSEDAPPRTLKRDWHQSSSSDGWRLLRTYAYTYAHTYTVNPCSDLDRSGPRQRYLWTGPPLYQSSFRPCHTLVSTPLSTLVVELDYSFDVAPTQGLTRWGVLAVRG